MSKITKLCFTDKKLRTSISRVLKNMKFASLMTCWTLAWGRVPGCWTLVFLKNNLQSSSASVWLHSLATPPLPVRLPSCLLSESAKWSKLPKPFVMSFQAVFLLLKRRHGKQNSLPDKGSQVNQSRLLSSLSEDTLHDNRLIQHVILVWLLHNRIWQ